METHLRPQQFKPIPQARELQNGDIGNNKDLPLDWGVGNIHRLQGRLLPFTHSQPFQKVPVFSQSGSNLPIQSSAIWSIHSTHGVYSSGKGGQTDGLSQGYKNPPVPSRPS